VIARARRVRLLLLDVDGVLTADRVLLDPRGRPWRALSLRDATAVALLLRAGIRVALLAERRAGVARLARMLAVSAAVERVTTGVAAARGLCRRWRIAPAELAFVGDDLLDQPLLALAGLAIAVGDAAHGLARHAHWTTSAPGGGGAVREVAELLLRAQGKWASVLGESMR
jgi:3-deoxy-D-manno-octulosonate 8-phosphate phosphatase (KDO 8-P phosphatase)